MQRVGRQISLLAPLVSLCCGYCPSYREWAGRGTAGCPTTQDTPQVAGMVQGKKGRKVVGPGHTPAGSVVLHPVPNNGEDVALHAPAPCGLLALVGQWFFLPPLWQYGIRAFWWLLK